MSEQDKAAGLLGTDIGSRIKAVVERETTCRGCGGQGCDVCKGTGAVPLYDFSERPSLPAAVPRTLEQPSPESDSKGGRVQRLTIPELVDAYAEGTLCPAAADTIRSLVAERAVPVRPSLSAGHICDSENPCEPNDHLCRNALASAPPEVSGEESERCKRCGRACTVWSASSPLWNAVIRGGSINGEAKYNDMVCATCFMQLAEEQGIAAGFRVTADQINVELETTTPSGRIWSEDRQLWVDPAPSPPEPSVQEGEPRRWVLECGYKGANDEWWFDVTGQPIPKGEVVEVMPVSEHEATVGKVEAQLDRANDTLEEAEHRVANWKRCADVFDAESARWHERTLRAEAALEEAAAEFERRAKVGPGKELHRIGEALALALLSHSNHG